MQTEKLKSQFTALWKCFVVVIGFAMMAVLAWLFWPRQPVPEDQAASAVTPFQIAALILYLGIMGWMTHRYAIKPFLSLARLPIFPKQLGSLLLSLVRAAFPWACGAALSFGLVLPDVSDWLSYVQAIIFLLSLGYILSQSDRVVAAWLETEEPKRILNL